MGEFFVYSAFFAVLLVFFPIFLTSDSYLDFFERKLWFSIGLYGVRVIGGYAELRKEGIAVHLTKKFAALIPYDKMADTRKKFEVTKGFQLYRHRQILETGGAGSVYSVLLAGLIQAVTGGTFNVLKTLHPFLNLGGNTLLADRAQLKLTFETTVVFNGFVLLIAFAKKLTEAFIQWIRKRKSTASSSALRSSS